VETINEFADEIKAIKQEIYEKGDAADAKTVASWLDRLLIALDKIAPTLDLLAVEVAQISEVINNMQKEKSTRKMPKKAKKKKVKKTKKSRKK